MICLTFFLLFLFIVSRLLFVYFFLICFTFLIFFFFGKPSRSTILLHDSCGFRTCTLFWKHDFSQNWISIVLKLHIVFALIFHRFSWLFWCRFTHWFFLSIFDEKWLKLGSAEVTWIDPFGSLFATLFFMLILCWIWLTFGLPLAHFGLPLAHLWLPMAPFWLPLGSQWLTLGSPWLPFGSLLVSFGSFWVPLGSLSVTLAWFPHFCGLLSSFVIVSQ